MKSIATIALFLFATPAFSQQQSPGERALGAKLLAEINAGLQCSGSLIVAQDEIAKLQAHIKELEAKVPKDEQKK